MSDPLDDTFNFISKIDLLNLGSLIELRIKETLSTNVQVSFTKERYCNSLNYMQAIMFQNIRLQWKPLALGMSLLGTSLIHFLCY